MSTAISRLERLLALVPYLQAHPGVPVASAASDFGISQASLLDDLQLLFVCGLPGHLPDDLIDVSVEGGVIHLSNAEAIARPLRLRPDEALALLMGLKVLTSAPLVGPASSAPTSVVHILMDKLAQAAGVGAAVDSAAQALTVVEDSQAPLLATIGQALAQQRQLLIEYHSPRRDSVSTRHIDPLTVEAVKGRYYVQAWCHDSGELRTFRTDRIISATLTQLHRQVPQSAPPTQLPSTVYASKADDVVVAVEITPHAQWMIDYYNATVDQELGQGRQRITLRTPDVEWVIGLALRMGRDAVVVAPPWLAQQVRDHAQAALGIHAAPTSRAS